MSQSLVHDTTEISVDYLFAGLGAGNSLLLLHLYERGVLQQASVAVFEPQLERLTEKTFCFWATPDELKDLKLESLVSNQWEYLRISNQERQSIHPYRYYHVNGSDLYHRVCNVLSSIQVHFYKQPFQAAPVPEAGPYILTTGRERIRAHRVFDNRPPVYLTPEKNQSHLHQSFYGWKVEIHNTSVDPYTAVLMDFSIPQQDSCQFVYVLPFSETRALIEVTRFGCDKLQKQQAELLLEEYMKAQGYDYRITEREEGCIPMSSSSQEKKVSSDYWIPTGSRADLLKPSTGYAFYSMARDAKQLTDSLINQLPYDRSARKFRFSFYDRLLLKILEKKPVIGKQIFQSLFSRVPTIDVLTFLNEKSNIGKEAFIFSRLPLLPFVQAAAQDIFYRMKSMSPSVTALLFTLLSCVFYLTGWQFLFWGFLGAGFLTIGLSHGAIDHLADNHPKNVKDFLRFIVSYLLKGMLLGVLWLLQPDLALASFILFSAWHFGQADFHEWKLKQGVDTFLWGLTVLAVILLGHFRETISLLGQIPGLRIDDSLNRMNPVHITRIQALVVIPVALVLFRNRSVNMLFTLTYLMLSLMLPLLVSFGIYFVFQHSFHGWRHLKSTLKMSSYQMWVKSIPFSAAGAVILIVFMLNAGINGWGMFFILLACISMPHVLSMHLFYRKNWATPKSRLLKKS